jgi:hypothetical protein
MKYFPKTSHKKSNGKEVFVFGLSVNRIYLLGSWPRGWGYVLLWEGTPLKRRAIAWKNQVRSQSDNPKFLSTLRGRGLVRGCPIPAHLIEEGERNYRIDSKKGLLGGMQKVRKDR